MRLYNIYLSHKCFTIHVPVVQNDSDRQLKFYVMDHNIPDNTEVRLYVKKPSGHEVWNTYKTKDNGVIIDLSSQTISEPGMSIPAQLTFITDGINGISTFTFYLDIDERVSSSSGVESGDEYTLFDQYVHEFRTNINLCQTDISEIKKGIFELAEASELN